MTIIDLVNTGIDWLANAETHYQRVRTIGKRRELFESMVGLLREPPDGAAKLFGQDKLLATAEVVDVTIDAEHGIFLFTMAFEYFGHKSQHSYSLYLTGDVFRVGLLLSDGLEKAPLADWGNEMDGLWPGMTPAQQSRQDATLYEWVFVVPDIYTNYVTRERFVFGMRHMQGRVLRILHDYFKMKSEGNVQ